MTRPIGGRELEQMLGRLAAAEGEVSPVGERPAPLVHFRRLGPWLVEERFLIALLGGRARGRLRAAPPRLADTAAGRLFGALALPPRLRARCRAQAIFAKTHLRAFYLEPEPLSVKLMAPGQRDALARELHVRATTAAPGAPILLSHRLDGDQPHLCEELIFGRHPDPARDADPVIAFVLGELWEAYRASGFEWRRCADSHDLPALLGNFDAMTDGVQGALREALSRLGEEVDRLVPWCLGHGDLSLGNMLLSDGRIRLLDWEGARRLPLLHDLAKIAAAVPGSWEQIAVRIREQFKEVPPPGMVTPRAQAALAALERLVELRRRFGAVSPRSTGVRREASRFDRRLRAELRHMAALLLHETG